MRRATEADMCANADAYTFTIIGIGSFVEGLLLELLLEPVRLSKHLGARDQDSGTVSLVTGPLIRPA